MPDEMVHWLRGERVLDAQGLFDDVLDAFEDIAGHADGLARLRSELFSPAWGKSQGALMGLFIAAKRLQEYGREGHRIVFEAKAVGREIDVQVVRVGEGLDDAARIVLQNELKDHHHLRFLEGLHTLRQFARDVARVAAIEPGAANPLSRLRWSITRSDGLIRQAGSAEEAYACIRKAFLRILTDEGLATVTELAKKTARGAKYDREIREAVAQVRAEPALWQRVRDTLERSFEDIVRFE